MVEWLKSFTIEEHFGLVVLLVSAVILGFTIRSTRDTDEG